MLRCLLLLAWTRSSASYLPSAPAVSPVVHPSSSSRHAPLRLSDDSTLPPEAFEAVPPEQLADAWVRDDKARELAETLKGCSLYLIGFDPRNAAVARILARRLKTYRHYDVTGLVCSTYKALTKSEDEVTLESIYKAEPVSDIEMLSTSVMQQVQQNARSVFSVWEGAVGLGDFAVMQQGIVIHLEGGEPVWSEMPAETKAAFAEGHAKADVTVPVGNQDATDDLVFEVRLSAPPFFLFVTPPCFSILQRI